MSAVAYLLFWWMIILFLIRVTLESGAGADDGSCSIDPPPFDPMLLFVRGNSLDRMLLLFCLSLSCDFDDPVLGYSSRSK